MIVISNFRNATLTQKSQLLEACQALNNLWTQSAFENAILAVKTFTSTDDTPAMVVSKIKEAGTISVAGISFYTPSFWQRLKQKFSGWIVDGDENPDCSIDVNADAWANMMLADRAAFLAHECMHVLGYTHDFEPTAARPYSAPYQIEAIVQRILTPQ